MTLAAIYHQPMANLIPHKRSMIWLDRIVDCHAESLTAIAKVDANNPLCLDGETLPAWVGIEWMAQAVAAFAGIHRLNEGKPILLGFLVGTRSYRSFCSAYTLQDLAVVNLTRSYMEGDLAAFHCTVRVAEVLKAEATITVFQPEDYESYMRQ